MRAQLAAAVVGCLGLVPLAGHAESCAGFTDVDSSASYCPAVDFLKNKGVVSGCTETAYCPTDYVTRAQMALFMRRLARGGPNNVLYDATASVGGGNYNTTGALYSTVAGGNSNTATGNYSTVAGGLNNEASAAFSSVAGGVENAASGLYASITGGQTNIASGAYSGVAGGLGNSATNPYSFVAGGIANTASGAYSTVSGGYGNTAYGYASMVPGGAGNVATGSYSFVAGRGANDGSHPGSFIWADSSEFNFQPSVNNFFAARATGGVGFTVAINGSGAPIQFCNLLPGTPSWQCTSDVNAKDNLVEADGAAVLGKLMAMPVYTYSMKGGDASVRSMGPTAQDFREAFGLGSGDTTIAGINLDGVALAAIKGLKAELDQAHAREAALEQRLERLEARLQ